MRVRVRAVRKAGVARHLLRGKVSSARHNRAKPPRPSIEAHVLREIGSTKQHER
jgi:hypothetical protein